VSKPAAIKPGKAKLARPESASNGKLRLLRKPLPAQDDAGSDYPPEEASWLNAMVRSAAKSAAKQ
jgi:hypothetical protein